MLELGRVHGCTLGLSVHDTLMAMIAASTGGRNGMGSAPGEATGACH
jgi:hypothetical protein